MKKLRSFPKKVKIFGETIFIREEVLEGRLGYFRPGANTICIHKDQPWEGKCIIFIHEMLHAVDELLIRHRGRKKRIEHLFITEASSAIFVFLVQMGIWKDVQVSDMIRFMRYAEKLEKARGRKAHR